MSYSRFGPDSDVYVFYNTSDQYECCGCVLEVPLRVVREAAEMLAHLELHRQAGHLVPEQVFERLKRDIEAASEPV